MRIPLILILMLPLTLGATPVMRVVKSSRPGVNLLNNGSFEARSGGEVAAWQAWQNGFHTAAGEGRGGSSAVVCENHAETGEFGVSQTLTLSRTAMAPLVVRGWSKSQDVNGSADSGYSLYVDLTYADDTPLWGQTTDFHCGTHDWEQREFVITPAKPVKSLTVHCLFRGHTGKVWFDDVTVEQQKADGDALLFQGAPVQLVRNPSKKQGPLKTIATHDGLELTIQDHSVRSLRVDGRELAGNAPSGFMVRDVAANSDVYPFEIGACPDLHLKLQAAYEAQPDHLVVSGRLSDTTGKDRAVTLLFALPLDASGWRWGEDIRHSRPITSRGEYAQTVSVRCGATGSMSLYPLAALSNDRTGIALALDMARPAQYRLAYHAGTKQLLIAYDFGLVKESRSFPSGADFRFVIYRFDPRWGFRAALQKLYAIFPDQFVTRSKEQGLWMPFTDIATVQGWQDFGFRYHEGNNNVPFDDAHGILSFRYTEPMTWWMPMQKGVPRTEAEALRVRDEWARGADGSHRRMAEASRVAAMSDEDGHPALLFRNEPWADGAVWSLNPNPLLPGPLNGATVHWNETIRQNLYGPTDRAQLDGEYLDSLEGYVTAELNYRREHFVYTTVPLTFATESKRPALFKGLAVAEFTRWIAGDVHRRGKLMFANGLPYRFTFLCPWLDVMGTETDWQQGGRYEPTSDEQMSLWRSMSAQKPYLLLMNTNFDTFTPDRVEKYFQRSLFYGMFPGMFSHNAADNPYWQNPTWYSRDRPLFKRYLPLIKRVAEAGWQPVTAARSDNPRLHLERFGPDATSTVYLTLMNESDQPQRAQVAVDAAALKLPDQWSARELLTDRALMPASNRLPIALQPREVRVVAVRGRLHRRDTESAKGARMR